MYRNSFNSRAPRGARLGSRARRRLFTTFQFTCPSRSTTASSVMASMLAEVSIHVPLAEHDIGSNGFLGGGFVSIHVPLAEHDRSTGNRNPPRWRFNSRAPRGARPLVQGKHIQQAPFQFTCPSRSTTFRLNGNHPNAYSFNSRAPRGARREHITA